MILFGVILFFIIVAIVLSKTETPVHLDNQNKPITTQDNLEDVIIDDKTVHVKTHEKERIKEEIIETTTITVDDFVEKGAPFDEPINYDLIDKQPFKEEFKNTVGGKQLTEHIAKVIELNPNSKKHLTRRQRNTVDKIVKEKNKL